MDQSRQDPDELLEKVKKAEERASRGRLKIFLGASAGVGKTYAMLSEAHEQKRRGRDVIIGCVETHGRKETGELLNGLEQLPLREIEYRGIRVHEFDLDGALVRRPELILIDELAHSNAPTSRHQKRYQDVEEVLRAGIDVYTALNIQHLESLNDVVAQITGVVVKETVPDVMLERADHVSMVDIPPDDLLQRLKEGKVYVPGIVRHATENFFKKGNLIALRELALRRAADQVDAEMQVYRTEHGVRRPWRTRDRILVCVAPNSLAVRIVRTAGRIGARSDAELLAVSVASDRQSRRSLADRTHCEEALRLAESFGMDTVFLTGHDIASEILRLAESRNISTIIVGKPIRSRWHEFFFKSVVDEIVRRSGDIDVYVVTGEGDASQSVVTTRSRPARLTRSYALSVAVTTACTLVCLGISPRFELSNLIMVYLLGVAFVATRYGFGESVVASTLSVLAFDYFFVAPRFTFAVTDTQYLVTFGVMLAVALLISRLAQQLREQARESSEREHTTASLYRLSKELGKSLTDREIAKAGAREIRNVFEMDVAVFLENENRKLELVARSQSGLEGAPREQAVAQWVFEHSTRAGRGTATLPGSTGLYLPLTSARGTIGVLAVRPTAEDAPLLDAPQLTYLETFANGLALAVDRTILERQRLKAEVSAESERMRSTLLSSVSHDLLTPLTSIGGMAALLSKSPGLSTEQRGLGNSIVEESERLNRHVRNLLDITRLEVKPDSLRLEWESVEEIIGAAVEQTERDLSPRSVNVDVEKGLPLLRLDSILVEKALINLLENAARYTPSESPIEISARRTGDTLRIDVSDRGPGLPPGSEQEIFEKFVRGDRAGKQAGFGLGLAICKAIMKAHQGHIWAENRDGGGALFALEFDIPEQPSTVTASE